MASAKMPATRERRVEEVLDLLFAEQKRRMGIITWQEFENADLRGHDHVG